MTDEDDCGSDDLPAGEFSAWLDGMRAALRGERPSEVPCGDCTACCTSSQFVHISPDETDALEHIPRQLLFPAPRLPAGHLLMGYDQDGRCPMLIENACSIYHHRPRTCRTYDCRIFPAAGIDLDDDDDDDDDDGDDGGDDTAPIARRARRWRFEYPTELDQIRHDAVRAAAAFVRDHGALLPNGVAPANRTQLAVLAVEASGAFLHRDAETGRTTLIAPDPDAVRVVLSAAFRA